LLKGSTVTAQELDANLAPIGKQYSYQLSSDLGTFEPNSTFNSQHIGVIATGYYFDEIQNSVSGGPVTLNAYADLASDKTLNVNLLTTLAYQRIRNLITTSGLSFADARAQAEGEVLAALGIPKGSYGPFTTLDLAGNSNGDHILAALSSLFVYGNAAGPLNALIASVQGDIGANGKLTIAASKATLVAAAKALNPAVVAANLTQRYAFAGVTFSAADLSAWIDQDGDGIVGKFKFQVTDATPTSTFTLPSFVVDQLAGNTVSVTAGVMSINGSVVSGATHISSGDIVAVSPGAGPFPSGVMTIYIVGNGSQVARVSFVSTLVSINVTAGAPSIPKGITQQFHATGTFSDGSTADLSSSATWTSSVPAVVAVNATGLATSIGVGSALITAASGSVSGTATLTVTPAVIQSLAISPNPATTGVGVNTVLTATGTYSDGTTADVTNSASWSSNTPAVATVVPTTGIFTGVSMGSTTITATLGSFSATTTASVTVDEWYWMASLISNQRCDHTATLLPSGKVLVTGGWCQDMPAATAEIYDPVANTWTSASSMATARSGHTAVLLGNGKVLVVGGYGRTNAGVRNDLSSVELYDPGTNTWSAAASMSTPRVWHTTTLLPNGKVLAAGGNDVATQTAELYDPVSDQWTPTGTMITARSEHTATLLASGQVLVAGGLTQLALDAVELYDPSSQTWSAGPSLHAARFRHTATLLNDGRVLVAGGFDNTHTPGDPYLSKTETYDPNANAWIVGPNMLSERESHTATLLPDGSVLVTGGWTQVSGNIISGVERYDPVMNTWTAAGSLRAPRAHHTATLLPSGALLVIGGNATNYPAPSSAEIN
jgi:N-acetylneuraminic acid mutarotase